MRKPVFMTALGLALLSAATHAAGVDGVWKSLPSETNDYILVKIGPCADDAAKRCGVITHYYEEGQVAESDVVGKDIIMGMKPAGEGAWKGGTIWAPDEDKTYSSKMALLDANTLEVSGCVLRFLCRGQAWTRVP